MADKINEKIALTKRVAEQYYEKREKKLKDEITLKQQEISLLQTAVKEYKASMDEKNKTAKIKLDELEKLSKEKDDTIATLRREKNMLVNKLAKVDEEEEKKRKTLEHNINEERQKFNKTIASISSNHTITMKQAMDMFNERMNQLTRSNDNKLEFMRKTTEESLRKKDEECNKKITEIMNNASKKLKSLSDDFEAKIQDAEMQRIGIDQEAEYKYEVLYKQKFSELTSARLSAEKRSRELEEIVSRHISVIEQWKERYSRLYQESQEIVKKLSSALVKQEQIISTEIVSRENSIEDLKNKLNIVATECGKKLEEKDRIIAELKNGTSN
jgi:hypothetical protein